MSEEKISAINVGSRFRKDVGDLSSMCKSIEEIGLLHPIVVDENSNLIAGYRRYEAYIKLGRKTIPVTRINLDEKMLGELHENTIRKDFTPSEIGAIIDAVESTRIGHRPSSVITAPRGRHSEKPEVLYEIIEKMYPEYSKLELFARNERTNWTAWGLEATKPKSTMTDNPTRA